MATKVGLGVPMPLMTPATAAWAAPFAAYYLFLQNRVVFQRVSTKTYFGDKADPSKGTSDSLYVLTRAQLNFYENVPLALTLALLAELAGADREYINYALASLFALRVSHVELGLLQNNSKGRGRTVGYFGTQAVLMSLTGYLAYLTKEIWSFL